MSANRIERALARLGATGAALLPMPAGDGYGVYPDQDRRRRPLAKLTAREVRDLAASGALVAHNDGAVFALSPAGRARVRRSSATQDEAFLAQHGEIGPRALTGADGRPETVRAMLGAPVLRRLASAKDGAGAPWLTREELAAAERLYADHQIGQRGLSRSIDWSAPARQRGCGSGGGVEAAMAAGADARARVASALARLAPPLRRIVEQVILHEHGIEQVERLERLPPRSGKLALKLALAQLAAT